METSFNPQLLQHIKQEPKDDESAHNSLKNEDFRKVITSSVLPVASTEAPKSSFVRPDGDSREEADHALFCNPEPPKNLKFKLEDGPLSHRPISNEDFRKMVMSPNSCSKSFKHKREAKESDTNNDGSVKSRKMTKFESPFNVQPDNKLSQLAKKFRRIIQDESDAANTDRSNGYDVCSTTGYHTVPSDVNSTFDTAKQHRSKIEESKYLGGNMENTYLVKGLDYILLQKTREEIINKERKQEELEKSRLKNKRQVKKQEGKTQFKTKLGKSINDTVFRKRPERNEMFLPNFMFYSFDLNDEDTDMPANVIRSKSDCRNSASRILSINDSVTTNVIKKFSGLRLGNLDIVFQKAGIQKEGDKIKKEGENIQSAGGLKNPQNSIYGDIGDYVPSLETSESKETGKNSCIEERRKSYFKKPDENSLDTSTSKCKMSVDVIVHANGSTAKLKSEANPQADMTSSYVECYPGALENEAALADSDDEADYPKAESGNSKTSLDFHTQEDSISYMRNRGRPTPAAFQRTVKISDGRKTGSSENKFWKAKLDNTKKMDRELQQINRIIAGRKNSGTFSFEQGERRNHMRPKIVL